MRWKAIGGVKQKIKDAEEMPLQQLRLIFQEQLLGGATE